MIQLLLDSSSSYLSVGIAKDREVIATTTYYAWQNQSELMVPEIVSLLGKHNYQLTEVTQIAVAIGPGSYTGVRIALTIAKILGYALKIPVYPISSLKILKHPEQPTVCLINARSGRSYVGVYHRQTTIVADTIMTNEEVIQYVNEHPSYLISGDIAYLGLKNIDFDIFLNLLEAITNQIPINDIHALKPVYLKDQL